MHLEASLSTSPEEFFKYHCKDPEAVAFYEKGMKEKEGERIELLEEQIYFAETLIEEIQEILNQNSKASEIKRLVKSAISNSSFEV